MQKLSMITDRFASAGTLLLAVIPFIALSGLNG